MSGPLLLTGASGWFGRTALWEYEQEHGPEALRRDVIPFASCERWVHFDSPHGPVKALPLEAITEVQDPRGLLHMAFLTRDKLDELGWQRYVASNRAITACIAAVLKAWPSMPVVTTSSGAAAALDGTAPDLNGNPYATLKQEEEELLKNESSTRMAMVLRVYAVTGRFMTRPEKFALGDFLNQAIEKRPIRVKNHGLVQRSYVHAGTMLRLCWHQLLLERSVGLRVIDACLEDWDIRNLADFIAKSFSQPCVLPAPCHAANPADVYTGHSSQFLQLLKLAGIAAPSWEQQCVETALGLEAAKNRAGLQPEPTEGLQR